ncbi:hypothetical protein Y032_0735g1934 [Ancylostoma ceylanicum]|uniref:SSD domain-containing protein n=1 Tax=Ancylostoma ceylanicum TaxID=53326 RepID=A0A016WFX6_9BILA|nr:hypothetical protein Y032_0735g1934 [Ancylostoma ceylanicum]
MEVAEWIDKGEHFGNNNQLINAHKKKEAQKPQSIWTRIWHFASFRLLFYLLGRAIGDYPRSFLLLSMLVSLSSLGMDQMELRDSIREGYTPLNAKSFYESEVMRQFSDATVDPMRLAFMMLAKDGKSMHRKSHLDEAERIIKAVTELTVKHGGQRIVYKSICEPYCFGDQVFRVFKEYFDEQYHDAVTKKVYSAVYNLTYPYATVVYHRVPIDQCLFGVRLVNQTFNYTEYWNTRGSRFFWDFLKNYDIDAKRPIEFQITNMEHVTLIAVFLYGSKNTSTAVRDLSLWELGIYDWSKQYNRGLLTNETLVELLVSRL